LSTAYDVSERARRFIPAATELQGRVIAITGAGTGIGRAVARAAAAHGAQVILIGRNVRQLEQVHAEIGQQQPGSVQIAPLDLERALARDYDQLAEAVQSAYGRLDGLLHNAAMLGALAPIEHYDVPTWYRVMHVNVTAAFALTQVLLPALRQSADASIIFTSSTAGRRGYAFWGAYAVSKFAIEGLSQVLAEELRDSTLVRVNVLNPGRCRTRLRRQAYPSEDLATLPEPESLVNPYLWLLGPASRGFSGLSLDAQESYLPAPPG
jgi:NAD(P)-dependent dehydrogenase (short-subunit alcohol dehydrogenase family)